jgi:hypothetical protein
MIRKVVGWYVVRLKALRRLLRKKGAPNLKKK